MGACKKSGLKNHRFIFLLSFVSYFFINYKFLFCLTDPSDPLQYVEPAINPIDGFPFLDRLMLWLWIRFIAMLNFDPVEIGGIATLTLTSLTLATGVGYLVKRENILAGVVFFFLFSMSVFTTGIASYTYPMQMLTFVLVFTLLLFDSFANSRVSFYILGFGYVIAIFSKIQGVSFGFLIIYLILKNGNCYKTYLGNIFRVAFGFLCGLIVIGVTLFFADGQSVFQKLLSYFVSHHESTTEKSTFIIQFIGRGEGGLPPIHHLLYEPTFFLSIITVFYFLFAKNKETDQTRVSLFVMAAIFQGLGLILIYLITQRGGPVIFNYFMDSVTLALVATSIMISNALRKYININRASLGLFLATPLLILFFIFCLNLSLFDMGFKVAHFKILLLLIFLFFWLFYFKKIRKQYPSVSFFKLIAFYVIFSWTIFKGLGMVQYAIEQMHNAAPYHRVSIFIKRMASVNDETFVSFIMDRPSAEDATFRLKQTFATFYKGKEHVIFFYDLPPSHSLGTILTDRAVLLNLQCEEKETYNLRYDGPMIGSISLLFGHTEPVLKRFWILRKCKF